MPRPMSTPPSASRTAGSTCSRCATSTSAQPPRWNRDPKTGIEAPLAFGKLLDYRDPDVVGDIKYLWEPNRHLHLVTLAQGYALTGKQRVLRHHRRAPRQLVPRLPVRLRPELVERAGSRRCASSTGRPPGSCSGREILEKESRLPRPLAGLDLPARAVHPRLVLAAFVGQQPPDRRGRGPVHRRRSPGRTGRAAQGWRETAKAILEREALAQNAPDGVNREQAVAYQQFVLDFQLLCLLAGKANGQWFSADYESRLESMLDYLASIMDAGGNVPMFGDADDGFAVRLAPQEGFCPYKSLLATGALLFRRGDFKLKARTLDDKTRWLFGAAAPTPSSTRSTPARRACRSGQTFPEGGYFVLGCDFDTPARDPRGGRRRPARLPLDRGARPRRRALASRFRPAACEFLIDPGTYAYHTQERWRNYFRGTSAHNTVRIDGARPVGARRQLHVAVQGARRLQPVAVLAGEGQLRGLARRLHAPRRPGEAPAPDRARQARAPRAGRGHARDGRGARRRALLPLPRGLLASTPSRAVI